MTEVKTKEIKDLNDNVEKKPDKDSIKSNKHFSGSYFYITIAFAVLSIFILKTELFGGAPIFESKIKLLLDLENEINSFDISLSGVNRSQQLTIDLIQDSTAILSADTKLLSNCLTLQEKTAKVKTAFGNSLGYYGNTLWKLRELNIEKLRKEISLTDRLFSFFTNKKENDFNGFNEDDFNTNYSLLHSFWIKFSHNKNDFLKQISDVEKSLGELQGRFNEFKRNDRRYDERKKFYEQISTTISYNTNVLRNLQSNLDKLRENNLVIGYIFMKLKDDFKGILERRYFYINELELINSYLHVIRQNRKKFLENSGLSVN